VGLDGNIYGVPSHATRVLKVTVATGAVELIGASLASDSGFGGRGTYRYGGAVVAPDGGLIYCLPSDADRVLRIDPATEEVVEIGPSFRGKNKWQNGFVGRDGAIYGIPCDAEQASHQYHVTDDTSLARR